MCVGEDPWDAYDMMGVSFQQHAAGSAYNAHYDRAAVLAALEPVAGRQVLDAACEPDDHDAWAGTFIIVGARLLSPAVDHSSRPGSAGGGR